MAKFLQQTLDEMSLESKGESHSHNAKSFKEFFDNVSVFLSFFQLFELELKFFNFLDSGFWQTSIKRGYIEIFKTV